METKNLDILRKIYLKAETDIINEIGRLRSQGLVDYNAVAALKRVQRILQGLVDDSWRYVPKMIEEQFYVRVPEARRILEPAEKHMIGYANAEALTGEQYAVVDKLITACMSDLMGATATLSNNLENLIVGRQIPDLIRLETLKSAINIEATGRAIRREVPQLVTAIRRDGVTAFTDAAGRKWSLHTYANMALRTTARQAEVLAVLTADPDHDLYMISENGTTCAVCAPLEGRVYSKSGTDPDFPPLAEAFGKIDPDGATTLENSWLNIHPNCLHALIPWTPIGRSEAEIERIKRKSSFATNPRTIDPRSEAQIRAYRNKEKSRSHWLNDYRQWENYKIRLGDKAPKTFETFQKHKNLDDNTYKEWQKLYRSA